jgi:hypothetical protein
VKRFVGCRKVLSILRYARLEEASTPLVHPRLPILLFRQNRVRQVHHRYTCSGRKPFNKQSRIVLLKKICKMTSYISEYPSSIPFDAAYKKFFEDFYAISDTPDAHERYVDSFTKDATLIMASKQGKGSEGTASLQPPIQFPTIVFSVAFSRKKIPSYTMA